MNAITSIAQTLTGSSLVTAKRSPTLAQCKTEMQKQLVAGHKGMLSTMQAAVALGDAATMAKALVGHGKWGEWLKENFEAKGTWVRKCMCASEVWHKLDKRPDDYRLAYLERFNTVEKFADTLPTLDQGEDPLVSLVPGRTRAPNKLKIVPAGTPDVTDVTPKDRPDTGTGANEHAELAKREKALDRREKELDARSAKLDTREQKLVLREGAVAQKEAALAADAKARKTAPTDAKGDGFGLKPDRSIEDLKAAKLATDAKAVKAARPQAPADAAPRSAKAPKPKSKGVVAMSRKIAPETVSAIQAAVVRAVDHSASSDGIAAALARDPMTVKGGMNPDASEVL